MEPAPRSLPESAEELFDHLIALGSRIIENGEGEAAYHLLAANLACAESLGSTDRVALVESFARAPGTRLDSRNDAPWLFAPRRRIPDRVAPERQEVRDFLKRETEALRRLDKHRFQLTGRSAPKAAWC